MSFSANSLNVVRIHLQLGKFMDAPDKPNARSLELLRRETPAELRQRKDIGAALTAAWLDVFRTARPERRRRWRKRKGPTALAGP